MFNVSAIHRLRQAHNLTAAGDGGGGEAEVSSLLRAPGMNTERLWRETMHTKKGMIKEASSHVHATNKLDCSNFFIFDKLFHYFTYLSQILSDL